MPNTEMCEPSAAPTYIPFEEDEYMSIWNVSLSEAHNVWFNGARIPSPLHPSILMDDTVSGLIRQVVRNDQQEYVRSITGTMSFWWTG